MRVAVYGLIFLLAGNLYCLIEMLYRARTHYSMFFCAGIVVVVMYYIYCHRDIRAISFALLGATVITMLEMLFGIVFNLLLKQHVWDYSAMPLNVLGQICLPFSLIWFVFSLILYYLFRIIGRV